MSFSLVLIDFALDAAAASADDVNPYDIPYLYGRNTMSTRGRILLGAEPQALTTVNSIVSCLIAIAYLHVHVHVHVHGLCINSLKRRSNRYGCQQGGRRG